jgi:hypothetical protein
LFQIPYRAGADPGKARQLGLGEPGSFPVCTQACADITHETSVPRFAGGQKWHDMLSIAGEWPLPGTRIV